MPTFLIYPLYTGLLAILVIVLVPRQEIRKLLIYGLFFGAIIDVLLILVVRFPAKYINYGPFGFMDLPFFPPMSWVIYYIIYFYFLPSNSAFRFIYVLTAASYSVIFSNVLMNLGIFQWNLGRVYVPMILYTTWLIISTWGYLRLKRYGGTEEV